MPSGDHCDILIVGSGLMGAAVAHELRQTDSNSTILMVEAGPSLGSVPGQHLHDAVDREQSDRYNRRVASGVQGHYTGVAPTADVGSSLVDAEPGMYHLPSIGDSAAQFPGGAVSWNVGGMGVHWMSAVPTPWGEEVPGCIEPDEWETDLERAKLLLRFNPSAYPETPAGIAVARTLHQQFDAVSAPGRGFQPMPMAMYRDDSGVNRRVGPNLIFPAISDEASDAHFTLLADTLATELHRDGRRIVGVSLRHLPSGEERLVRPAATIVCADAIRTPQLLFASGIRPAALGRYLNEHAFMSGRVLADPARLEFAIADLALPLESEWVTDHYWLPHSGRDQPFQLQVANTAYVDDGGAPIAYAVGLTVYVPTEILSENRLEFSDTESDAAGMPKITVHFRYSDEDTRMIERARDMQRRAAESLGAFDPTTEAALLPPGSSLHLTGTARMGGADDGTSVCDPDGKVWGFNNLYLAGNGLLPTAMVCNVTLSGMVTAVRAARAANARLGTT